MAAPAPRGEAGASREPEAKPGAKQEVPPYEHHTEFSSLAHAEDATGAKPLTGYCTTIMHLIKCYVGTGIFAMGEGFKHSGLILGPVVLSILAIMNLNCQHILINVVEKIERESSVEVKPTFSESVEYTMELSTLACLRNNSKKIGWMITCFLCFVELGFCSVYFVFIANHLVEIACDNDLMTKNAAGNKNIMLAIVLLPMWASTFLGNLKLLLPLSITANILMWIGVVLIIVFTTINGLPPASDRDMVAHIAGFPLFFGTALYAFEGITFVIPLRNEMRKHEQFTNRFGVLNVGMITVALLFVLVGILSYWKYGDDVKASVFLNLKSGSRGLSDAINAMMAIAVMFTFTLHMYIPFEVTFPLFYRKYGPFKKRILVTFIYRSIPVFLTFFLANIVPFLGEFISLVGASVGAFLALILPPFIDLIAFRQELTRLLFIKDIIIITVGILGSTTGTAVAIKEIGEKFYEEYFNNSNNASS